MRHATVLALNEIYEWFSDKDAYRAWRYRACDWSPDTEFKQSSLFINSDAKDLKLGKPVTLPDCPACAALLDLALEMRGGL